ncbi:hypothetical protein SLA2020_155560 [Shorea laevis]
MRFNCCHVSFAFFLKFLNFLQGFVGLSIVIYSLWMLNQWNHHVPIAPPPLAPSPASSLSFLFNYQARNGIFDDATPLNLAADLVSGMDNGLAFDFNSIKLPAPWFIYSFMGVGILLCCVSLIGCIAAEVISGCCLCFYTLLKVVLILLEAALVAFIAIDHHWEKDLPFDPTGELDSLRSFIESNIDICKWVGITIVTIQVLSLLLAIILRGMVSARKEDLDGGDDYENVRGRTYEPLLNPQLSQTSSSAKGDTRGTHSDIWGSRIREKYGLNSSEKYSLLNQNASASVKSK